jgi:DNA-binding transcriptional MerR regulator
MPFHALSTLKVARAAGVHPNTVRLYESLGFISPVPRNPSGYRLFDPLHLDQMLLARLVMGGAFPGSYLRRSGVRVVRSAAAKDFQSMLIDAQDHLDNVLEERQRAEEGAAVVEQWASGENDDIENIPSLSIGQMAKELNVSIDMLRNWERSGLLTTPRNPDNRYRMYGAEEHSRLRVIRMLIRSGYSTMAVLRMLATFDSGERHNLRDVLDTPRPDEDILTAPDRWLTTLEDTEDRARAILRLAQEIAEKYAHGEPPGNSAQPSISTPELYNKTGT